MSNDYFKFKQFTVRQDKTAMKVGIDSVLLGSWVSVNGSEKNVLDIGTGTGLLALMTAQRIPEARITACEIDENACEQARENIASAGWNGRIDVVNIDIRMFALKAAKFDLIVSNPPYFERSLKPQDNKRNLARHNDSLPFRDLMDCVHRLLCDTGRFALIVPDEKAATIIELARNKKLFPARRLNIKPKETKPVNRVILELCRTTVQAPEEKSLTVRTENGYSDDYKSVTKDFYL
jgi:tRNA1Val (adenine37-N6)-methyltransferase